MSVVIYNEDCRDTIAKLQSNSVDVVLTSPPYNGSRQSSVLNTERDPRETHRPENFYDEYNDHKSTEEYILFIRQIVNGIERILSPNGVILLNLSYSTRSTTLPYRVILDICDNTAFALTDTIIWKKSNAVPNNVSRSALTRIWEFVFVLCRKTEIETFNCNKKCVSRSVSGQNIYDNVLNFVTAKNNDEVCPYNRATYSVSLCEQLLQMYAPKHGVVFDPFMGSGTTGVACERLGISCIGSEISRQQCEWANARIKGTAKEKVIEENSLF